MDRKLKDTLHFVAIAWPAMMIAAYLLSFTGAFAGNNLLVFVLLGLPALFIARFVSLQFFDRAKT